MPIFFNKKKMRREIVILILSGICLECLFLSITLLGNLRNHVITFIAIQLSAFLPYAWCLYYFCAKKFSEQLLGTLLRIVILFSVLFRMTLLFSQPSLSDDIYRYLWDGKVLNHGVNPYRYAPGAEAREITVLRSSDFSLINHKDIGTTYGPVTLAIFALAERISHTALSMKIPFVLFDVGIIYLLFLILRKNKSPSLNILTYAWNPLVIVEIAGSGHNDPLAIFFLWASIYFWHNKGNTLGALTITLSVFSKYFSSIFLPVFLKEIRGRLVVVFLVAAIAIYGPFYSSLENHFLSIITAGSTWRFNDSVFSVLFSVTGSFAMSKILILAIFVAVSGWVVLKDWDTIKSSFFLIGTALLLTTTLHPWYLLWIVPFLCFYQNAAWLSLTALVSLSYHVLTGYVLTGIWNENQWIRWLEYVPFYGMLVYGYFSRGKNNASAFRDS